MGTVEEKRDGLPVDGPRLLGAQVVLARFAQADRDER
jgi:hypothetical protein